MTIIEISGINAFVYASYMGEDMVENLNREFYRGLAVVSDEDYSFAAGIVWEYRNVEGKANTESVIRWIRIMDPVAEEALFRAYSEKIKEYSPTRSRFVIPAKEGKAEKGALKRAGFTAKLTEGDNVIVSLSELLNMPLAQKRKIPEEIGVINELSYRAFKRGITKCTVGGRKGLCEDLIYLPMTWFETDVSCYIKKEDLTNGFLLFHKLPSGMLSIQLMYAMGDNAQQNLIGMIRRFLFSMEEKYPADTKILLNRHNQASLHLSEKLLPRGFGIPVYAGERVEQY